MTEKFKAWVKEKPLPLHSGHDRILTPRVSGVEVKEGRKFAFATCPRRGECHTQDSAFYYAEGDTEWRGPVS